MNNAIITVVGSDQVGIIAKVSAFLAEKKINIADISQTILSGNFVMMMMVDMSGSELAMDELRSSLDELGNSMGVDINVMHERVFSAMHRV
ncbi:MAG: ACT domain-containing protein [Treponema sp.]|nr:ACT domain-containing protein [Candidatus Treponema caballi]